MGLIMGPDLCGDGFRQSERLNELAVMLMECRRRISCYLALLEHIENAGTCLFNVACQKKRFRDKRIMRQGCVRLAEGFYRQGRGQFAPVPNDTVEGPALDYGLFDRALC